jgi:hypothetical protein
MRGIGVPNTTSTVAAFARRPQSTQCRARGRIGRSG